MNSIKATKLVRATLLLAAAFLSVLARPVLSSSQEVPVIAAASDLKFALEEIAAEFKADTGLEVRLAFGSSGNFARQIRQGAPFEMFMSADENFALLLVDDGLTLGRGELYAIGRIVLFAPTGSPLVPEAGMSGLGRALSEKQVKRFAIANPEHAPYGRAAEEALRAAGLWEKIRTKLVIGENVSQAAQFAITGAVQGSIFAYSLALAPSIGKRGNYVLLPEDLHRPLRQRMVLLKSAGETATRFFDYVQTSDAREVFRRNGFSLPNEAP